MASKFPITSSDVISQRFSARKNAGSAVLIPYITSGYPDAQSTVPLMQKLADAGADIIELGVPFSDPVADGATIQRSSQHALEQGMTLAASLELVREFRRTHDTPVVVFSYLNPILAYGSETFLADAIAVGANGVLIVDLPLDADPALEEMIESSQLSLIRLLAPTTDPARAQAIAARTQGFLYYVARLGVTGARAALRGELLEELQEIRAWAQVPVAVGFGISTASQAVQVAREADGIIVGSAVIEALDRGGIDAAAELIASMRTALDRA